MSGANVLFQVCNSYLVQIKRTEYMVIKIYIFIKITNVDLDKFSIKALVKTS